MVWEVSEGKPADVIRGSDASEWLPLPQAPGRTRLLSFQDSSFPMKGLPFIGRGAAPERYARKVPLRDGSGGSGDEPRVLAEAETFPQISADRERERTGSLSTLLRRHVERCGAGSADVAPANGVRPNDGQQEPGGR